MKLPAEHLVLFDGACALCASSVRFLLRHDRAGRLHFAALQSSLGRSVCLAHGLDPESFDTFLYARPGRPLLLRSDAALAVAALLGFPWSLLPILRVIPRPLRDATYSFVARNRFRWFGRHDACLLPDPIQRARFHG